MALPDCTAQTNIIASLGDNPNQDNGLTAAELKKKFDAGATNVKDWYNTTLKGNLEGQLNAITTALGGKASASHTHPISEVTNLQTTLDGKAASSHTHTISDVTDLQDTLDGKENALETEQKRMIYVSASTAQEGDADAPPSDAPDGTIWIKYEA